jgi:HK97 gp10 family phage protein
MGVKTTGFAEFAAKLRALPQQIGEGPLRSAAVAGGTLLRDEVSQRAPDGETGNLKRAVYLKFIEEKSSATRKVYYVSIRRGTRKGANSEGANDVAYYGHMVEFGHWYVPPKPKGVRWKAHRAQHVGKKWVPAVPFMRPGFEARRQDVIEAMRERLKERLLELEVIKGT